MEVPIGRTGTNASDLLVIFGITGDLARKMTFRALYRLERKGLLECPIVGVASDDISVDELIERARGAIERRRREDRRRGVRPAGGPAVLPARRRHRHGALRALAKRIGREAPALLPGNAAVRCSRRSSRTWAKPGC